MKKMKIYNKYKKIIEYVIYPLALLIQPLMKYNMGVDVSDSTYSLGNYLFADKLEGMWVISTYLSNTVGSFIMKLPKATTLKGANIYTGLILSLIGLMIYFGLKNDFDARYVFLGEFIAMSFCWIPTGILYNYLSYLVMAAGAILLYKGIIKQSSKYLWVAGLMLGMNVFVRIPNITQMALIVALWLACFITGKKWIKDTFVCIGGYVIGVAVPGCIILAQYGISGIADMIAGLSGITSTDETYTPLSMIVGPIKAYGQSAKWLVIVAVVVVCGCVLFRLMPGRLIVAKSIIYLCVVALMLRFFWGRGMFSFRYYEDYTSMYEWGVMTLYLSIAVDVYVIAKAIIARIKAGEEDNDFGVIGTDRNELKQIVIATVSLVVIMIAPLGSNNNLYQNLNNLFLVLPFTIYIVFGWIRNAWIQKNSVGVPVAIMLYVLVAVIGIQSFGFGQNFVFRDGMRGEKRDTMITGVKTLEGMYTNADNAKALTGLCQYIEGIESKNIVDSVILFGDCPGLTYVLNKPSALFSSWIDLDSNPVSQIEKELNLLKNDSKNIPVIVRMVEGSAVAFEQKNALIHRYIEEGGYELSYENEMYKVYTR